MVRETLVSALAWIDGEPWLLGNLEAMGASHREYGVRGEMYDAWVASLLTALSEVLGADWCEATERAWGGVLDAICAPMRAAACGR